MPIIDATEVYTLGANVNDLVIASGNDKLLLTTTGNEINLDATDGDINITCNTISGVGAIILTAGGNNDGSNIIDLDAPYGNIDITSGANISLSATGDILISGSILQFNNVIILPRRFYSSLSFSVSGSPTGTIFNTGNIADMVAFTIWKVEVAFYTTAPPNTRNVLTYQALDTTNTDIVFNSVFGYANTGFQTAIQYDPAGTPMGTYCSFVDTFEVSGSASGDCYFLLTGGTSDGSSWAGTANVSIVLIRLS
jgi:hypothetical protein